MNVYELGSAVARVRGCTTGAASGTQFDYMGNPISGCDECCGCEFGQGRGQEDGGLAGGMRIVMRGSDVRLQWDCPGCGVVVNEDTLPISAIDDAEEIAKDPLCVRCRTN